MKALITGAGGFLGQNLVNFLLDKDFEIFNLGKNPANGCIHCSLPDISDESSINEHIKELSPIIFFILLARLMLSRTYRNVSE